MRWTRNDVHDGMSVTSTKGDRLGKVISRSAETFVVEKGVFFPKDYELRYDHITDMGSGGITYSLSDIESRLGRSETARTSVAGAPSSAAGAARAAAPSLRSEPRGSGQAANSPEELRIP